MLDQAFGFVGRRSGFGSVAARDGERATALLRERIEKENPLLPNPPKFPPLPNDPVDQPAPPRTSPGGGAAAASSSKFAEPADMHGNGE